MSNYKNDGNFLRCSNCGKYRVDCVDDFEVNYKEDGTKEWLCSTCNKYKKLFKGPAYETDMYMIIAPDKDSEDCIVYKKEMYI